MLRAQVLARTNDDDDDDDLSCCFYAIKGHKRVGPNNPYAQKPLLHGGPSNPKNDEQPTFSQHLIV